MSDSGDIENVCAGTREALIGRELKRVELRKSELMCSIN